MLCDVRKVSGNLQLDPMKPIDASFLDIYTPDRCCFSSPGEGWVEKLFFLKNVEAEFLKIDAWLKKFSMSPQPVKELGKKNIGEIHANGYFFYLTSIKTAFVSLILTQWNYYYLRVII